jgi:5-methyltetrahydropteroyltriglutamate--homocysteine methyltransferase
MGLDPDQALDEAIRADNACLEGAKRDGVIMAIHLCRGNNRSQWYADGGYDAIAEKLFGRLQVDAFLLEYESARAGTFEPLRFVPRAQDRGSRAGEQQAGRNGVGGPSRHAHRPSRQVRAAGQSRDQSAMRLRLDDGRKSAYGRQQWQKLKLVVDTAVKVWGQAIMPATKKRQFQHGSRNRQRRFGIGPLTEEGAGTQKRRPE